eukprot:scaffold252268_cov45-Attheya_sp.AAC.1
MLERHQQLELELNYTISQYFVKNVRGKSERNKAHKCHTIRIEHEPSYTMKHDAFTDNDESTSDQEENFNMNDDSNNRVPDVANVTRDRGDFVVERITQGGINVGEVVMVLKLVELQ